MKIPVTILQDTYEPVPRQNQSSNQTQTQAPNRTIVYIDGQNFLHRCSESLIKSGAIQNQQELANIDVRMIFKRLFPMDNLEIRYYGVNKIRQRKDLGDELYRKAKKFSDTLRKVRSNLMRQGIVLCDVGQLKTRNTDICKNCGYIDYKFQEKGVDVGLASEMVRDAALKLAGKIVLVSSDIDMLPAIKIAKEFGVEIIYVSFNENTNNAIANNVDGVRCVRGLSILEAYVSAMNFKSVKNKH